MPLTKMFRALQKQARLALKSEVEKYVIHLIEKYCQ
jgi:hypothetical protein